MIEELGQKRRREILIAEDEMIVAEDLAMTLQDLGYQVAGVAATGELTIQMVRELKPDLVLMDIKLAGDIDGIEAAREIRTGIDVPVVFVTAYDAEDVLQRATETEPYGYIAKPFSFHILRITVETALYKHAADKRVRESEEKYRLLAENANVGIFTASLDGAFLQANTAGARMAGYESVEEFLAIRTEQLYPNAVDRERFLNKLLEKGSIKDYEILAQKKEGTPRWFSLNAVLQKDHAGNPISILAIVEDITDRKTVEEALRQSEERYRTLVSISPDGMLVNVQGRLAFANDAAAKMLGMDSPNELVGKDPREIVHADSWETVKERIRIVLNDRKLVPLSEQKFVRRDGTIVHVETIAAPIVYEGKLAVQVVVRDITERKRAEEERRK